MTFPSDTHQRRSPQIEASSEVLPNHFIFSDTIWLAKQAKKIKNVFEFSCKRGLFETPSFFSGTGL
jgi:hypothetical protein